MSSSVLCSTRLMRPPPHALFTRMSTVPHASTAACTIAALSALRLTSVRTNRASAPKSSWSALATRLPALSSSSATSTRAPSAAKRRAIPRPMPSPEPVTMATRSCRRPTSLPPCVVFPEALPRLPTLGERHPPVGMLGPVGGREPDGVGADVGPVPELVHAAHEVPTTVAPLVGVAVEDRLVDPPLADLDLALAVHVPVR